MKQIRSTSKKERNCQSSNNESRKNGTQNGYKENKNLSGDRNNKNNEIGNTNNQIKKKIELQQSQGQMMIANIPQLQMLQQNQYLQQQMDPVSIFRQRLSMVTTPDGRKIEELTELAKHYHHRYSLQIAEALIEKILTSPYRLTYMYILDSILKNVQGNYIQHFEQRIAQVFQDTFQRAQRLEEKKPLIKMFKIWDLFFQPQILEQISKNLELLEYERTLLDEQDLFKIQKFKRDFQPCNLPDEVWRSGLFISGSDTNNADIERIQQQRKGNQVIPGINPMTTGGQGGQSEGGFGMMGPPVAINPTHQSMQGNTTTFIPQGSRGVNVGNPMTPSQQSSQVNADLLNQLKLLSQQPGSRAEVVVQQLPSQQTQQQPFIQQPQSQQTYPSSRSHQINVNQQQYPSQGMPMGREPMPRNGSSFSGSGSSSGLMYHNAHNDDNFAHKQQTLDHKQIGFLPSILKSFYQFKENQQFLIGQDPRLVGTQLQGKTMPPSFNDPASLKEFNLLAIAEVYDSVKFQCSVCGLRFIRNLTLKKHLDMHFNKNNEFRKRGNRAVSRPEFMSIKDFIQPKASFANQKGAKGGQGGLAGQSNIEDMVPYSNKDAYCYICKEKFEVVFDEEEEQWFFTNAKKIRMQSKKAVVIVHSDCLKQIEMNREMQKQIKGDQSEEKTEEDKIVESDPEKKQKEIIYDKHEEQLPIEDLEKQIRGLVESKKQFLGKY